MFPFNIPENIRKPRSSGVFREYQMGTLAKNGFTERLKTI